jgi:hypothetical protein
MMLQRSCRRLIVLAFLACGALFAQDAAKIAEPEFTDQFFVLVSDGTLKPLERQTARQERRRLTTYMVMPGDHSGVRFPDGRDLTFILRVTSRQVDPQSFIQLFRLKTQSGHREIPWMVGQKTTVEEAAVAFEAVKYGQNSFAIRPKVGLTAGEYVLSLATSTSQDGFCFGVEGTGAPVSYAAPASTTSPTASAEVIEPEYTNKAYALCDGKLTPLEHVTLTKETRTSSRVIAAKQVQFDVAKGPKSPVRLPANIHFVMQVNTGGADPADLIHLRIFKVEKKDREFLTTTVSASVVSGARSKSSDDQFIAITLKKYGALSFEIIPTEPLAAGEYFFQNGLQADCFSVDAK